MSHQSFCKCSPLFQKSQNLCHRHWLKGVVSLFPQLFVCSTGQIFWTAHFSPHVRPQSTSLWDIGACGSPSFFGIFHFLGRTGSPVKPVIATCLLFLSFLDPHSSVSSNTFLRVEQFPFPLAQTSTSVASCTIMAKQPDD